MKKKVAPKPHRRPSFAYVYRSAITGWFVTAKYAKRHPRTTYRDGIDRT